MESGNRRLGLGCVGHLDETEAAGTARLPICEDLGAIDDAIRFEQPFQFVFCNRPIEVPDKNTGSVSKVEMD